MKIIKLTQNVETIIDDEDFERVIQYKWFAVKQRDSFYAFRGTWKNGKSRPQALHHFILNTKQIVDHIDGNSLDNRKINLRICTNKENVRNSKIRKNNKTGFKGVNFLKILANGKKPWKARIMVDGKEIHLGYFSSPEEAASVYNEAATKYFGEFARLNIIPKKECYK